jgi:hypothetical protein
MSTASAVGAGAAAQAWSPEPSHGGASPEEQLLALIVFTKLTQTESAKGSVDDSYEKLEDLKRQIHEATERAKEAQKHSGFFGAISNVLGGDIGAIAGLIASVAAVVVTGGAAAAVLAVVASAVSIASQHAKELGIPPEVAMGIAIVAAGAALCCGNASGLIQVSEGVKKAAATIKLVASATSAVANAGAGGANMVKGVYDKDVKDAQADTRWSQGQRDLTNVDIDEAIKLVSDALAQSRTTTETLSGTLDSHHQASDLLISNYSGAA